jgi:hypothetical protein
VGIEPDQIALGGRCEHHIAPGGEHTGLQRWTRHGNVHSRRPVSVSSAMTPCIGSSDGAGRTERYTPVYTAPRWQWACQGQLAGLPPVLDACLDGGRGPSANLGQVGRQRHPPAIDLMAGRTRVGPEEQPRIASPPAGTAAVAEAVRDRLPR